MIIIRILGHIAKIYIYFVNLFRNVLILKLFFFSSGKVGTSISLPSAARAARSNAENHLKYQVLTQQNEFFPKNSVSLKKTTYMNNTVQ